MDKLIEIKLQQRIQELKEMGLERIAQLPKQVDEELFLEDKLLNIAIWHDELGNQKHLVAVQIYKKGVLGCGKMFTDGFVIDVDGVVRDLTLEEWAQFS